VNSKPFSKWFLGIIGKSGNSWALDDKIKGEKSGGTVSLSLLLQ
jgi:hypothetical protein